ncbi:MAG: alpha/beta fold hydrolase [Alphaproteobacteria bacterium]|nr:alpha/beta fold hydrolase [Alphaproteobacteria bacterium]
MNALVPAPALGSNPVSGEVELLLGLWRRVLQTADITPDSNFFDLGGDSLLALNLFLEIERATGRQLPITAIYDAQTVAEQAALLQEEDRTEFSPLVLLKRGSDTAPLFIFHGIGGTVVEFAELGRRIGIDGAVYAVQAQGIDGTLPPLESVEEMAALYVQAIESRQPHGPYWLCGYSFGGVIAIEVARRLRAKGEKIGLLFMIDAYAHPITWPKISQLKVRLRRTGSRLLSNLRAPSPAMFNGAVHFIKRRLARGRNETPAQRLARKRTWLKQTRTDLPLPLLQTRFASDKALIGYRPSYYPGKTIFLKAAHPDPDFPRDPKRVYRGLFEDLTVRTSPGSHTTIIHQHAADVAAAITAAIRGDETRPAVPRLSAIAPAATRP